MSHLRFSQVSDPFKLQANEPIESPFDMEAILQADAKLLALWKAHPFTFDLDEHGRIITRYVTVCNDEGWEL